MQVAVDDLTDDWHRAGGRLSADDIYRLASKRDLTAPQLAAVLTRLDRVGIRALDADTNDNDDPPTGGSQQGRGQRVADVSTDLLTDYLRTVARHDLIYAEDEVRLGRQIKAGQDAAESLREANSLNRVERRALLDIVQRGEASKTEFVQANLRLVIAIARSHRYESCGVELADRIQDGNIGLMRAVDKFDHTLGFKFSTYATWWIRQSIERGIGDRGRLIRIPIHFHENVRKVRGSQRVLHARYGRAATMEELARHSGLSIEAIRAVFDHDRTVVSLDTPVGTGDITLGDLLCDEADIDGRGDPVQVVLSAALIRDLQGVLSTLDDRGADVLSRRFGLGGLDPMSLDEIGGEYGVTRERIRQIQNKTLDTLSSSPAAQPLYEYLIDQTHDETARPPNGWPTIADKHTRVSKTTQAVRGPGIGDSR